MKKSIRRVDTKVVFGPGGMRCPCCRWSTPCECKVLISRRNRRINWQTVARELKTADNENQP